METLVTKIYAHTDGSYTVNIGVQIKNTLPAQTANAGQQSKQKEEARSANTLQAPPGGSPCWARTNDIVINSHALYRLS